VVARLADQVQKYEHAAGHSVGPRHDALLADAALLREAINEIDRLESSLASANDELQYGE
jgi:hypothetical protein